jgi:hypothetical protein
VAAADAYLTRGLRQLKVLLALVCLHGGKKNNVRRIGGVRVQGR